MPIYTYKCYDCEHSFDVEQSVKSERKIKCPNCKHLSLERLIYPPIISVRGGVNTIGQLAESNSKKMGKYKISEIEEKNNTPEKKEAKEKQEKLSKISKMNKEQTRRYVENGEL